MTSRSSTELYERFASQFFRKVENPTLQNLAIAWNIVAQEPTHIISAPRIPGPPLSIPDVYPKYDNKAFSRLLVGSFDLTYDLIAKALVKVKEIAPPNKGEKPRGVLFDIRNVLRDMSTHGIPQDDSVMTVILQYVENIKDREYNIGERAHSHATTFLNLIQDAAEKGYPLENPGYGVQILDIGCGDGSITSSLCSRLPNAIGHGVDIQDPSQTFKDPFYDLDYIQISETDTVYPYEDGVMSLVITSESIHHIRNISLVNSLLKKVRRGGLLLIKEHDVTNRDTADYLHIRHFLDTVLIEKKKPEEFMEHYFARYTTRRSLRDAITSQGFRTVPIKDPYGGVSNPMKIYHEMYVKE